MTFGWDHLHLRSPDPDAAAAFYQRMFGAVLRDRIDEPKLLRVTLDLAGLWLFIDRAPAETARCPEAPYLGLEHFGLRVDKLDEVVADLKARGAEFLVEPTDTGRGAIMAFLRGPDGVRIELLQRG
jgi:catechol 2,3-dioxygenase-like lactoylglutathione lyase family enzyme